MGIFRSIGRTLTMPYAKSLDSVSRIGRALGGFREAAASASREQTDALAAREDKPDGPRERFDWYCEQLGLSDEDLAHRAANFEMVRKTALVATGVCLVGALVMAVLRRWFFCATDLVVALTFGLVALRNAYYLHQVLAREVITLRTFMTRPTLFTEWFTWRRR